MDDRANQDRVHAVMRECGIDLDATSVADMLGPKVMAAAQEVMGVVQAHCKGPADGAVVLAVASAFLLDIHLPPEARQTVRTCFVSIMDTLMTATAAKEAREKEGGVA